MTDWVTDKMWVIRKKGGLEKTIRIYAGCLEIAGLGNGKQSRGILFSGEDHDC